MLIELARYTVLFALTAVGLQTFLLCPTLWSGGTAVAIKLGFRGMCFTAGLLLFSFFIILWAFAAHDFSLAIVFESFSSQKGALLSLQAFCSSREGYFFTFIILFTIMFLNGFSKRELATYQERGRYLFAGGFLIFFLLVLMLTTANPFVRIEEPPFEGIGFNPEWLPPYKTIFTLLSFGSCACLTVSFIKTICMYSKGRFFIRPLLRMNLVTLILLLCVLGGELMTDFTVNDVLWQWMPVNSLLLSVLLLITGQTILLFFSLSAPLFTNWILFSSFLATSLSIAGFLAVEYRLFSQSDAEVYFPNPIVALCALAGIICFFLFLNSVALKKHFKEKSFSLFARESFAGLSFVTLMAASISIGALALLPALFMFLPDLPLRLLPALIRMTVTGSVVAACVFLFIAFKRRSVVPGWIRKEPKSALLFRSIFLFLICLSLSYFRNGFRIIAYSLPSVLIFESVLGDFSFKIPRTPKETFRLLKTIPAFRYGVFFCAFGFFIFSTAFSCAFFNHVTTTTTSGFSELGKKEIPCSVEQLAEKSVTAAAKHRLICRSPMQPLKGDMNFQWREKELKARFLKTERFSTRLIQIDQIQENTLKVKTIFYPALQLAGSGIFLMCSGIVFLLFSLKRENFS